MLTLSGRLVLPGNEIGPSLHDIAVGLGRTPRFRGQTKVWWTVLHHSLVCERIAANAKEMGPFGPLDPRGVRYMRLVALLHDAHEAVISDIPTSWKPYEMRNRGADIDLRIFTELDIMVPVGHWRQRMKWIDQEALVAEAVVVGPDGFLDATGFLPPQPLSVDIVRGWMGYLAADSIGAGGLLVDGYVNKVRALQLAIKEESQLS